MKYEAVAISGWPWLCRASEGTFPELYGCSVEPDYVLSTRFAVASFDSLYARRSLLSPHRPFSRPDWFGVAQLHKSMRYPDESR
jgi:hypothetical protein